MELTDENPPVYIFQIQIPFSKQPNDRKHPYLVHDTEAMVRSGGVGSLCANGMSCFRWIKMDGCFCTTDQTWVRELSFGVKSHLFHFSMGTWSV